MSRETRLVLAVLVLVFAPLAAFSPTLANGFTRWDDPIYVVENPVIRDLSFDNLRIIFTRLHHGLYKPLTMLSFAVEHHFFGLKPLGYHATNLVLHTLNSLWVFLFIWLLSGKRAGVGLITALFFSVHPLRVESVAWIAERKDVLYAFFFLAGLTAYLAYVRHRDRRWLGGTLACLVLSLLVKPMGITLPIVLFLIDAVERRPFRRNLFTEKRAILTFAAIYAALTAAALFAFTSKSASQRIFLPSPELLLPDFVGAAKCLLLYVHKIILPLKLSCIYPEPARMPLPPPGITVLIAGAAILATGFRKGRFGVLFFFVTVLPVLPFIRALGLVSTPTIADRYTYIPSIGIFYALAEGAAFFLRKRNILVKAAMAVAISAVAANFAFLTYARSPVWKNGLRLWEDLFKNYTNIPEAYLNRGVEYHFRGAYEKAAADYLKLIEAAPGNIDARSFLVDIHQLRGETAESLRLEQEILERLPRDSAVFFQHLGTIHDLKKEKREAFDAYRNALIADPGHWPALKRLADLSFAERDYKTAAELYEKQFAAEPYHFFDHGKLGVAYGMLGRHREAVRALEKARALDPESTGILTNLAAAYVKAGEEKKAAVILERIPKKDSGSLEPAAR